MRSKLAIVLVGAAVALGMGSAEAADDPNGFVRNKVEIGQTLQQLLDGKFVVEVRCAEKCLFQTRIVTAQGVELGRTQPAKLAADKWHAVEMPLSKSGRAAVRAAENGLKIYGQTVASALAWTKNKSGALVRRKGTASWIRTCKWPR